MSSPARVSPVQDYTGSPTRSLSKESPLLTAYLNGSSARICSDGLGSLNRHSEVDLYPPVTTHHPGSGIECGPCQVACTSVEDARSSCYANVRYL